jgi:hypothetical protein
MMDGLIFGQDSQDEQDTFAPDLGWIDWNNWEVASYWLGVVRDCSEFGMD